MLPCSRPGHGKLLACQLHGRYSSATAHVRCKFCGSDPGSHRCCYKLLPVLRVTALNVGGTFRQDVPGANAASTTFIHVALQRVLLPQRVYFSAGTAVGRQPPPTCWWRPVPSRPVHHACGAGTPVQGTCPRVLVCAEPARSIGRQPYDPLAAGVVACRVPGATLSACAHNERTWS